MPAFQTDPRGKAKASDADNWHTGCAAALRAQVRREFEASLQYLLMGAHFAQDNVNLPGVSAMFFASADEERGHGKAFMEYLRKRGDTSNDFLGGEAGDELLPILGKASWTDAEEALRDALTMEKMVTGYIKGIIDVCEGGEEGVDYHAADWLTGAWLEEQLEGQRQLAGMINSLNSFRRDHEELADWMFDQHLQE